VLLLGTWPRRFPALLCQRRSHLDGSPALDIGRALDWRRGQSLGFSSTSASSTPLRLSVLTCKKPNREKTKQNKTQSIDTLHDDLPRFCEVKINKICESHWPGVWHRVSLAAISFLRRGQDPDRPLHPAVDHIHLRDSGKC
jgi:hypothetical protein